jgi:hypothetical protein
MSVPNNTPTLDVRLADALAMVRGFGLPFVATPAATRLEHDLLPFFGDERPGESAQQIKHLEGNGLTAFPIPSGPPDSARGAVRYFLDGVQRTLPIGWCGMNALALVVVVAGVIERRPQDGVFRAVPRMTEIRSSIIIASSPDDDHARRLIDSFEEAGLMVTPCDEQPQGSVRDGDFLALQSRIRPAVGKVREMCEQAVFRAWDERTDGSEGWLVMDGSLADPTVGRAVGVIKRHSRFDLTNSEMTALLTLPAGYRSSAFQRAVTGGVRPISWYLRLHEASGADPLFGLARIEAPSQVAISRDIDHLSQILYAERTPRATNDDRWPTLLYPIHIAERILKVKLERALLGVPAALRRYLREVA